MDLKKEQQILLSKQRIKYIDALRGFTMFLVVLQHIESIGFGIHPYESVLGNILVSFRMPMFFFISGYIAYKVSFDWNILFEFEKESNCSVDPDGIFLFFVYDCKSRESD